MIPHTPFYFVRHGQTDWNKTSQTLCDQDDISLNDVGLKQAANVCHQLTNLGITQIFSSPLARAKQTAEIINAHLKLPLQLHVGLGKIIDEHVTIAVNEILNPSHSTLIVSHGEVYRVLLRILNAQSDHPNAKNGGLYFFSPPDKNSDQWTVTVTK